MSEARKQNYDHITPELVGRVRALVQDRAISTKETYAVYNAVYQRTDKVQTCGTCVLRRVRDLRGWLATYDADHGGKTLAPPKTSTPKGPATGRTVNLVGGGTAVVEGTKATDVKGADGKRPRPGSYEVEGGGTIVVNVRSARFDAPTEKTEGSETTVPPTGVYEPLALANGEVVGFNPDTLKAQGGNTGEPADLATGTYPLADGRFLVVNVHDVAQVVPADVETITLNADTIFLVTPEGVATLNGENVPEGRYEAEDGSAYKVDAAGVIELDLE